MPTDRVQTDLNPPVNQRPPKSTFAGGGLPPPPGPPPGSRFADTAAAARHGGGGARHGGGGARHGGGSLVGGVRKIFLTYFTFFDVLKVFGRFRPFWGVFRPFSEPPYPRSGFPGGVRGGREPPRVRIFVLSKVPEIVITGQLH